MYGMAWANTFLLIVFCIIYIKCRHYGVLLKHKKKYVLLFLTITLTSWLLEFIFQGATPSQKLYFVAPLGLGLCGMLNGSLFLSLGFFSPTYITAFKRKKTVDEHYLRQHKICCLISIIFLNIVGAAAIFMAFWFGRHFINL